MPQNDLFCRILGAVNTYLLCLSFALFTFAILYRYERLLMILKGTNRYTFLQFWRGYILVVLFIGSNIILIASIRAPTSNLFKMATNQFLEYTILLIAFYILVALGLTSIIPTDLYCIYAMIREVLSTSTKLVKLGKKDQAAIIDLKKRLAIYVSALIVLAIGMGTDIIMGFNFFTFIQGLYGLVRFSSKKSRYQCTYSSF